MPWYEAAEEIQPGQIVVGQPSATALTVLPALSTRLRAGLAPLGVALSGARVGGLVSVAETGLVGQALTKLRPAAAGLAWLDPATASFALASAGEGSQVVGTVDAQGNVTLCVGAGVLLDIQRLSDASGQVASLTAQVAALQASVATLQASVAEHATRLVALEAGGEIAPPVVAPSLAAVEAKLADHALRIAALEDGSDPEQEKVTWPAVHFAGSGFIVPNSVEALRVLGDQTIEAWVFLDADPAAASQTTLYCKHPEAEGWFYLDDTRHPRLWLGNPLCSDRTAIASDLSVPVGVWTHLAVVVDRMRAGNVRFYMNGVPSGGVTWSSGNTIGVGPLTNLEYMRTRCNTPGEIAQRAGGYNVLTGRLAELRVWATARDRDASGNATDDIARAYTRRVTAAEIASLVGYWPMDEGQSANVRDASGHNLDATLHTSAAWVEGPTVSGGAAPATGGGNAREEIVTIPSGLTQTSERLPLFPTSATSVVPWRGLQLTNINAGITLPRIAPLQLVSALTLELWLRPDRLADEQTVVMTDHDAYGMIQLSTPSNLNSSTVGQQVPTYLIFYYGHEGGVRARVVLQSQLKVGAWLHLAIVRDTSSSSAQIVRFYINGILEYAEVVSDTRPVPLLPHYAWRISTYQAFLGAVSDLRLWSVARSDAQILDNYDRRLSGTEPGLVGYYRMDEVGSPTVVAHATDPSFNATAQGVVEVLEGPPPRGASQTTAFTPARRALSFRASSLVTAPHAALYEPLGGAFTVECWARPTAAGGELVAKGRFNVIDGGDFALRLSASNNVIFSCGRRGADMASAYYNQPIALDTWTHIAVVFSIAGNRIRFYQNGVQIQTGKEPTSGALRSGDFTTQPITLGQGFRGQLTDVRLWGVVRTDEEIRGHYARRLTGPIAGLLGSWTLDDGANQATDRSGHGRHGTLSDTTWGAEVPPSSVG